MSSSNTSSHMSINHCQGNHPPRGLKLRCFHKYVQKQFYPLLKNGKLFRRIITPPADMWILSMRVLFLHRKYLRNHRLILNVLVSWLLTGVVVALLDTAPLSHQHVSRPSGSIPYWEHSKPRWNLSLYNLPCYWIKGLCLLFSSMSIILISMVHSLISFSIKKKGRSSA